MKKVVLESFTLDHTKLVAPYVRHAKTIPVPESDYTIKLYDFRVKTPNIKLLDPKTIHTLEHLLATAIRGVFPEKCPKSKVVEESHGVQDWILHLSAYPCKQPHIRRDD